MSSFGSYILVVCGSFAKQTPLVVAAAHCAPILVVQPLLRRCSCLPQTVAILSKLSNHVSHPLHRYALWLSFLLPLIFSGI